MAHITTLGAGMFSDLSISMPLTDLTPAGFAALQASGAPAMQGVFNVPITSVAAKADTAGSETFVRVLNVRSFPSIGTPANIVNVAAYGSKSSQQVQGQADIPAIELTLNYIAADWAIGTPLGDSVGNGVPYMFRFALMNAEPASVATGAAGVGISAVQNSEFFWFGKVEALLVNPQLTDANTATLTLSSQTDFLGAYTET